MRETPNPRQITFTGERLPPLKPSEDGVTFRVDLYRHLKPYQWLTERITGCDVVEIGCGHGHGTTLLAERASRVIAIDLSYDVLHTFTPRGVEDSVYLCSADACRLPLRDDCCAVLVALQLIEHLTNPHAFLSEIARTLSPTGCAYISTPNARAPHAENPFHKLDYGYDTLVELLSATFRSVEVYGLYGSSQVVQYYASAARQAAKTLGLDPFGLRRFLPRKIIDWVYPRLALRNKRRVLRTMPGLAEGLSLDDFTLEPCSGSDEPLDFVAVCTDCSRSQLMP